MDSICIVFYKHIRISFLLLQININDIILFISLFCVASARYPVITST